MVNQLYIVNHNYITVLKLTIKKKGKIRVDHII